LVICKIDVLRRIFAFYVCGLPAILVPRLDFGVGFHPGHPLSQAHGLMPVEQTTGEPTFCSLNHSNYLYQAHQDISLTGGASQSVPARSSHGDPE
jgi:hypothetical protein